MSSIVWETCRSDYHNGMANATLGWYPKHTLSDMCSDICKFVDNTSV